MRLIKTIFLKTCAILLLVSLSAVSWNSSAESVRDLYTSSWPVSDQSEQVRKRALANAFAQVLVRASGHKKVLDSAPIRASLKDAATFMRLYSYKKLNLQEQKVYRNPLLLKVSFDPQAVTNLLKQSSQPVWNQDRPAGAYWIAVEENGERIIARDGQGAAAIAVRRAAASRGLPAMVPLMDLDDKSAVSTADVWGKFAEPVARASRRYNADYRVIGSLRRNGGNWQGSWLVDFGSDNMRFTTSGASKQKAVDKLVNRVADRLAAKLAVVLSNQIQLSYIQIEGISSIEAYAKAQHILRNLSMVSSVDALELVDDKIVFKLELQSSSRYLIDALALSNHFRHAGSEYLLSGETAQVYRWNN